MKRIFVGKTGYIRAGWSIAVSLVVYLLSAVLALAILKPIFGNVSENISINNISIALQQIICAGGLMFFYRLFYKRPLAELGFEKKKIASRYLCGIAIGFVVGTAATLSLKPDITWVGITSVNIFPILTSLILMISVGLGEELLARGYIMTAMRTTGSKVATFLSSCVIFSAIHLTNPEYNLLSFINAAVLGLVYGFMLVRTGSLWMPMGAHTAWNFAITNVWGSGTGHELPNSLFSVTMAETKFLTIGSLELPDSGLITLGLYILMFLFTLFVIKKDPDPAFTLDKLKKEVIDI
jgi:membrane protease YdiL (CAAX protease family)